MVKLSVSGGPRRIGFLSVFILICSSLIFYFSLPPITLDAINSFEVPATVFVLILVCLSVIFTEFSRVVREAAESPMGRVERLVAAEKVMFFFETSVIFAIFGLFASIAGSSGFSVLFFTFSSILMFVETTNYVLNFRMAYAESKLLRGVRKKKR